MLYERASGQPALLTAGGTRAILKLWQKGSKPEVLWEADFGGKFSRMRDVEVGDLFATADPRWRWRPRPGVVAVVRPKPDGGWRPGSSTPG